MGYLCLAIETYQQVKETSRGIGQAIGYYQKTLEVLERVRPIVMSIPPSYQETFNKKITEVTNGLSKSKSDNDTIYFDKVILVTKAPDAQNFVKLEAVLGDIETGHPIES